jgi:hypothetical protein
LTTNAFVAAYSAMYGCAWNPAIDATFTTDPDPRATIPGRNRCTRSATATTFTIATSRL